MRLRQTELPWKTRIVNRISRRGTRTAVIAGNKYNLCARFRNARRNGSDPRLGDKLDGNARIPVGIFQIIN